MTRAPSISTLTCAYAGSTPSALLLTPVISPTTSRAATPKTPTSRNVALSSEYAAKRGFTYFRTVDIQLSFARGGASTNSELSSRKMRRSAMIFPFGVSAAAYCPCPEARESTSLVTRPVNISPAVAPERRMRPR